MMNALLILAAVLVVVVAGVLILAAMKPPVFRVVRSTTIDAPPERVFGYINDFRQWPAWSPWEKYDPAMQRTHGGPPGGVGATYAWNGNKKVGQGRMEIVESTPPSKVSLKLEFIKPFKAHNTTDFLLEPHGNGTRLTWDMQGPNQCMGRVMQVFMDMDRMVGRDFEAGLANLKGVAEGETSDATGYARGQTPDVRG
jgi:uncharacterized protein YndB with AHSA1/START domain